MVWPLALVIVGERTKWYVCQGFRWNANNGPIIWGNAFHVCYFGWFQYATSRNSTLRHVINTVTAWITDSRIHTFSGQKIASLNDNKRYSCMEKIQSQMKVATCLNCSNCLYYSNYFTLLKSHFWERLFPLSCIRGKVIDPIVYNESLMKCSLANCSFCLLLHYNNI